jgi:hypothetical protein
MCRGIAWQNNGGCDGSGARSVSDTFRDPELIRRLFNRLIYPVEQL